MSKVQNLIISVLINLAWDRTLLTLPINVATNTRNVLSRRNWKLRLELFEHSTGLRGGQCSAESSKRPPLLKDKGPTEPKWNEKAKEKFNDLTFRGPLEDTRSASRVFNPRPREWARIESLLVFRSEGEEKGSRSSRFSILLRIPTVSRRNACAAKAAVGPAD